MRVAMSFIEFLAEQKKQETNSLFEAEYQGKKVELNKPFRNSDGPKKFSVYVKNDKGNVVKVNFGDPNMEIKRDDPDRRKAFRSRHNCDNPGPKWKARYWSCKFWEKNKSVTDLTESDLNESPDNISESVEEGRFWTKHRSGQIEMKHGEYQEHLKKKSDSELKHIIKDANEALQANPDNPKAGYYKDEALYAAMELKKRNKSK